jgi:3-oxoacyl-[acyl-carrier protein] reductase
MSFAGKTVLVTGGSKGIGLACVRAFAEAGATVFYTFRDEDQSVAELKAWAKGRDVAGCRSDATDAAAVTALVDGIGAATGGALDVLVNNVGDAVRRSSFADSDDALWTASLEVNLMSAVRMTRAFLPLLKASPAGVVVNMSSIAGTTTGAGDSLHYGVAKAALDTFTKGVAREMAGTPVRVVGVAPSAIDTDFQTRHSSPDRLQKIVDQTPLRRVGTAEEVAETVLFLASDKASYISGDTVMLTGGR